MSATASSTPARSRRTLPAVALLALTALAAPTSTQDSAPAAETEQQETALPRFRAETNFVRADVYVTSGGVPVPDLRAEDFEIFEDGKPQRIETFEFVQVRGFTPVETRVEPETVAQSRAMAEDPRARVFVVFLDTYHTDLVGSHGMQRAVTNMLDRLIGPDDVFAVMTPSMSVRDLAFARRTETVAGMLEKYWNWGTEGTVADFEPEEQNYLSCYPDNRTMDERDGCYTGVAREMIARRRERRSLQALHDLSVYLRDLRDERKAVVAFTSGWPRFRPNHRLARRLSCEGAPGQQPIGVDPQGRISTDPRNYGVKSQYACESDRLLLAQLDNNDYFLDLLDRANRGNVSFYPVDARGLRSWGADLGDQPVTLRPSPREFGDLLQADANTLQARLDTLRLLAGATDGLAVINTNNFDAGIQRIVADLTSYYLIGYYSTNAKLDGRFRSIKVRVNRQGTDVRARRGYLAPTREEVEAGRRAGETSTSEAPPTAVQTAFTRLQGLGRNVRLFSQVSWVAAPIDAPAEVKSHVWVTGEIDPAVSRSSDWAAGGEAELVLTAEDDITVATVRQPMEPAARGLAVTLTDVALGPGSYVLKVRLQPATPGVPLTDTLRFTVDDQGTPVGQPRLLRRGPTTGVKYMATAKSVFQRTERVRLEVPMLTPAETVRAELLDRNGKTMAVPVQAAMRPDGTHRVSWAVADLTLAPLAPGDYAIRTNIQRGGETQEVITAFRIVP